MQKQIDRLIGVDTPFNAAAACRIYGLDEDSDVQML
jgi:hypothetical protein